ncbi:MAG: hypothetical protein ACI8TE_001530 [Francisella sp.]|jgi:hypothetical protein
MRIFIKELRSQESGYSGDKPNQRGKYILVSQECSRVFPLLKQTIFNHSIALKIYNIYTDRSITVKYVWNNAKYHPNSSRIRAHNEYRMYRTNSLDEEFNLDKEVIVIFVEYDSNIFLKTIDKESSDYNNIKTIINGKAKYYDFEYPDLPNELSSQNNFINDIVSYNVEKSQLSLISLEDIQDDITIDSDNPLIYMGDAFKTQSDFTNVIRKIYGNKCAIRKVSLIKNDPVGLEAAHIQPRAHNGRHLPNNGILMSRDLHNAFDHGYFTIDKNLEILVHPEIGYDNEINKFHKTKILCPVSSIYFPFEDYLKHHRENVYGSFGQIRSIRTL